VCMQADIFVMKPSHDAVSRWSFGDFFEEILVKGCVDEEEHDVWPGVGLE